MPLAHHPGIAPAHRRPESEICPHRHLAVARRGKSVAYTLVDGPLRLTTCAEMEATYSVDGPLFLLAHQSRSIASQRPTEYPFPNGTRSRELNRRYLYIITTGWTGVGPEFARGRTHFVSLRLLHLQAHEVRASSQVEVPHHASRQFIQRNGCYPAPCAARGRLLPVRLLRPLRRLTRRLRVVGFDARSRALPTDVQVGRGPHNPSPGKSGWRREHVRRRRIFFRRRRAWKPGLSLPDIVVNIVALGRGSDPGLGLPIVRPCPLRRRCWISGVQRRPCLF